MGDKTRGVPLDYSRLQGDLFRPGEMAEDLQGEYG